MTKKDEVTTSKSKELAVAGSVDLEAYGVTGGIAPGTDTIQPDDVEIPRIRLIQGLSKEASKFEPDSPEFRPIGSLVHSGTGEVLLPFPNKGKTLRLIPLMLLRQRVWFDKEGGGLIARSYDAVHHSPDSPPRDDGIDLCERCPDSRWKDRKVPPNCGVQYAYPSLIEEKLLNGTPEEALVTLILAKSSVPEAKKLNTAVKMSRLPFFAFPIEVTTWKDSNDKGTFGLFAVRKDSRMEATDDRFTVARGMFEMLQGVKIKVDEGDTGDFFTEGNDSTNDPF